MAEARKATHVTWPTDGRDHYEAPQVDVIQVQYSNAQCNDLPVPLHGVWDFFTESRKARVVVDAAVSHAHESPEPNEALRAQF